MKEIVVISGKGGTGKTSISAALVALAENAVCADCDVDAADMHLVMRPNTVLRSDFYSGHEAVIEKKRCISCGLCAEHCRFDALIQTSEGFYKVDEHACEGCGLCVSICPEGAIDFPDRLCGEWYESTVGSGWMYHARLHPGGENSGKLVSMVREKARARAEKESSSVLIVDGPPGTGCPVIASISGCDAALIVTEPSLSGKHDMERLLKLLAHFRVRAMICVNKWDVNPELGLEIEHFAISQGAEPVGRVPYDRSFTAAQLQHCNVMECGVSAAAESLAAVWNNINKVIFQPQNERKGS